MIFEVPLGNFFFCSQSSFILSYFLLTVLVAAGSVSASIIPGFMLRWLIRSMVTSTLTSLSNRNTLSFLLQTCFLIFRDMDRLRIFQIF